MVVPFVLIWLAWRTLRYPGERMPSIGLWGWIVTGLAVRAVAVPGCAPVPAMVRTRCEQQVAGRMDA